MRQIQAKTGLGKSTVGRIGKELEVDKENHPGGRPTKLTPRDKQAIIRQITTGKLDTAVQATKFINNIIPNPVHPQTIRNVLKEHGFRAASKLPSEKYLCSKRHTDNDDSSGLWSMQTGLWRTSKEYCGQINRIGSDGKVYVWKQRREAISDRTTTPTVKHGGGNNLMVWGCMGWNGVGMLVEVQGKMDAEQYCEILDHGVLESFEKLEMEDGKRYFQQDNDPKHTSKRAKKWFEDNDVEVLWWPAQSPDLNPIEHLWYYVKRKLQEYEVPPKGAHELWERLVKEWNGISSEVCQTLIESMPRRIEAVIKAKGGHTKY